MEVEGNKNSSLPLLAACLLTTEECVLTNVPRISDVEVMARLILDLGGHVEGIGSTTLRVRCPEITKDEPDGALVGRLRGSVLLLGPLLARRGRAHLAPPGGDFPARRTIATHLEALESMGVRLGEGAGHVLEAPDGLKPTSIYLYEASVTGTETALLAGRRAGADRNPPRRLRAARRRPARFRQARRSITGAGTPDPDRRGAKLAAPNIDCGAITSKPAAGRRRGRHRRRNRDQRARAADMEVVAAVPKRMNITCAADGDRFRVEQSAALAGRITTSLWPGFPSDLVSLVTVLATQAEGRTLVHDWLYELRLFALEQLSGMSGDLFLCDPHRIIVTGPCRLRGRPLDSRDLRSGMALIAAGLAADGQSRLSPLETVERGYGRLVERLQGLGAKVAKMS